jgi:hypothetical protein
MQLTRDNLASTVSETLGTWTTARDRRSALLALASRTTGREVKKALQEPDLDGPTRTALCALRALLRVL